MASLAGHLIVGLMYEVSFTQSRRRRSVDVAADIEDASGYQVGVGVKCMCGMSSISTSVSAGSALGETKLSIPDKRVAIPVKVSQVHETREVRKTRGVPWKRVMIRAGLSLNCSVHTS